MKKNDLLLWLLLGGALLAALAGGGVVALAYWKRSANAAKYLPALHAAEDAYDIPRDLLARMAYQESRFREDIINGTTSSAAGARGLMQIVPRWHPGVDPLDPYAAIDYAARFLRSLYDQFKSWKLAVAAYNAGAGNVSKYNAVPPFPETQAYVSQIFNDVKVA